MDVEPPDEGRLLVAVGMGSNQAPVAISPFDLTPPRDPRARALEGALVLLRRAGHRVRAASPIFETQPFDVVDEAAHGPFLNACVLLDTAATPEQLLADCESAERAAGRTTKGDRLPRPLDLDLLAAWRRGAKGELEPLPRREVAPLLPHPRLAERAFVLVPLAGVLPDGQLAVAGEPPGTTAWGLLRKLARAGVRGVKPAPPSASFPSRIELSADGDA